MRRTEPCFIGVYTPATSCCPSIVALHFLSTSVTKGHTPSTLPAGSLAPAGLSPVLHEGQHAVLTTCTRDYEVNHSWHATTGRVQTDTWPVLPLDSSSSPSVFNYW